MAGKNKVLVRGGQVYDHDGDVHKPAVADILIEDGEITAVGADLAVDRATEVIDASSRLVVPGLINAHYHSHDTLCRGLFEELPLEMWLLYTLPMGQNRSKEEVRARTLVGAVESLRCGITTVQDMLGLSPLNEEYTDVVLAAYRECGIRVVFSPMVSDVPPIAMVRHKDSLPSDVQEMLGTKALPMREQLDYLEHQFKRHPAAGTLHWAIAPFAPQRCTPKMLEGCAELAQKHDLAVYTHVYETRGQVLIARELFARSRRVTDQLSGTCRPLGTAAQHRSQCVDFPPRNGSHGGRRRRHRAQPSQQPEAQERDRAGVRLAGIRRAPGPGL